MPVIPIAAQMILWAALLIFCAIYLHALDALPSNANGWRKLWKGLGILALLLGVAYLIGALSGARDLLSPLSALGSGKTETATTFRFERIKTSSELDARLAQAQGKQVMLDFYADWCVSCKEMERYTFTDKAVQSLLKNAILLQADVTANDMEDKALLQRFQLFGPPATLFFNNSGQELADLRITGYQTADLFRQSLNSAGFK
jgi:thiol:disulfide interchange protein DsbD